MNNNNATVVLNSNKPDVIVQSDVIHCANCLHAKEKRISQPDGKYKLYVRCLPNKWIPKNYMSMIPLPWIHRKVVKNCASYISMGDLHPYLEDLADDVLVVDEAFDERVE